MTITDKLKELAKAGIDSAGGGVDAIKQSALNYVAQQLNSVVDDAEVRFRKIADKFVDDAEVRFRKIADEFAARIIRGLVVSVAVLSAAMIVAALILRSR